MRGVETAGHEVVPLDIRLLGRFEVLREGKPIPRSAWGRRKTRTLLKVLLTKPGRLFTQDQLIDILFPGEDLVRAKRNLYGRVSELRKALEPRLRRGPESSYILREGQSYRFSAEPPVRVDTQVFEKQLADARAAIEEKRWMDAVERFEAAMSLYRGELLPEDRYEDWTEPHRGDLEHRYLDALLTLAECHERLGRLRQSISCCQRVLGIEPYREDVLRQLMTYQGNAGQLNQALSSFQEGQRVLREYLGVEPSTETLLLRNRIAEQAMAEIVFDPRRIAVLPLQNFSSDPKDDYIADAMTEELIGSISKIRDLRVVARTSVMRFKDSVKPILQIAHELNVGTILEGSIRKSGDRIRVTAQLIDAATEDHLWAEHYDLDVEDMLEMQNRIARQACAALSIELLTNEETALRAEKRVNPEARIAFLKGQHFLSRSSLESRKNAIKYFEESLRLEPRHARAMAGLARAHYRMVDYSTTEACCAKARKYAKEALEIDDTLAEAYAVMGSIAAWHDGDLQEGERLLRHAIALDPNCALAHAAYASLLQLTDRPHEAADANRIALSLDPLSPPLVLGYAGSLLDSGRTEEALEQCEKAIELDNDFIAAWWALSYTKAALWDWDGAEAAARRLIELHPGDPMATMHLVTYIMCRGRLEEGLALVEKALALPGATERISVLLFAGFHHFFGRMYDASLDYLGQALQRDPTLLAARIVRSNCYLMQGRLDKCLEEASEAEKLFDGRVDFWNNYVHSNRGTVYALQGDTQRAEDELRALVEGSGGDNRRIAASMLLGALGRVEEAIDWAESAADAHETHVVCFRKAPQTVPEVWNHPRYQALLHRIGLGEELEMKDEPQEEV